MKKYFKKASLSLPALILILAFQNCAPGGFKTTLEKSNGALTGQEKVRAQIAWDKSTSSEVKGYRVYLGLQTGQYAQVFDVGLTPTPNLPTHDLVDLDKGVRYYAVVKAYNSAGEESPASNEIAIQAQ